MSEPNESQAFQSEEAEAASVASELTGEDWNVEEGGAGPDTTPAAPVQGVPPQTEPSSPAQPSLTLDQARQKWQQATATRAQLREYAQQQYEQRQQYEGMLNAFLQAQQQTAQQQPQQPDLPPQIDPELQRYLDQQQQSLLAQMQQTFAPVLFFAQQQQQIQQVQQQVSQEQQQWTEFRQLVETDEQNYLATPEGQGYNERLQGFQGAMLDACASTGLDERVAQKLVNEELKGVTMIAMSLGQSPAFFMDNYAKSLLKWAQGHVGGNGQPRQQQRYAAQQQGRMSPNVQIARQATMSGAVGAPPSSGNNIASTLPTAADLLNRRLTDQDINAGIKQFGSIDKYLRHLETVGMELESIIG